MANLCEITEKEGLDTRNTVFAQMRFGVCFVFVFPPTCHSALPSDESLLYHKWIAGFISLSSRKDWQREEPRESLELCL